METGANPFAKIKPIIFSQKLLDIAFNKAMKIKPPKEKTRDRSKIYEINRINTVANVLASRLDQIIHNFPSFNLLHPFYSELSEIIVNTNDIKLALGRINGIIENIRNVEYELIEKIHSTNNKKEIKLIRKSAFGRFSSMINSITWELEMLENARKKLSSLPGYNPGLPCIVISGVPNVGKSSLIKLTTSGKPEVASYPFTTKKIIFGHRDFGFFKIQFVDTPGILDRPIEDRNKIELQALTALKYLADLIVFLIDLSDNASSSLESQINLLEEIKNYYSFTDVIVVFTKSDIVDLNKINQAIKLLISKNLYSQSQDIIINTLDKTGVNNFIAYLNKIVETKILKSSKFLEYFHFKIDPEQMTFADEEFD